MRLINADAIIHYQTYDDEHEEFPEHESTIAELLDELTDEGCPKPVDAVPVVRCKDCKWCNMGECEHKLGLIWANDENYCSLGERKDGDA